MHSGGCAREQHLRFLSLDLATLNSVRLDEQGRPDAHGQPAGLLLNELARREDWDLLDELLDDPARLGLHAVGDDFRGVWAFYDDFRRRMPQVRDASWLPTLGEGPRLPDSAINEPGLAALAIPGWVVLDAREAAQLLNAARTAIAADPDWAFDQSGNGPTWQALSDDLAARPDQYLLVLVLVL